MLQNLLGKSKPPYQKKIIEEGSKDAALELLKKFKDKPEQFLDNLGYVSYRRDESLKKQVTKYEKEKLLSDLFEGGHFKIAQLIAEHYFGIFKDLEKNIALQDFLQNELIARKTTSLEFLISYRATNFLVDFLTEKKFKITSPVNEIIFLDSYEYLCETGDIIRFLPIFNDSCFVKERESLFKKLLEERNASQNQSLKAIYFSVLLSEKTIEEIFSKMPDEELNDNDKVLVEIKDFRTTYFTLIFDFKLSFDQIKKLTTRLRNALMNSKDEISEEETKRCFNLEELKLLLKIFTTKRELQNLYTASKNPLTDIAEAIMKNLKEKNLVNLKDFFPLQAKMMNNLNNNVPAFLSKTYGELPSLMGKAISNVLTKYYDVELGNLSSSKQSAQEESIPENFITSKFTKFLSFKAETKTSKKDKPVKQNKDPFTYIENFIEKVCKEYEQLIILDSQRVMKLLKSDTDPDKKMSSEFPLSTDITSAETKTPILPSPDDAKRALTFDSGSKEQTENTLSTNPCFEPKTKKHKLVIPMELDSHTSTQHLSQENLNPNIIIKPEIMQKFHQASSKMNTKDKGNSKTK